MSASSDARHDIKGAAFFDKVCKNKTNRFKRKQSSEHFEGAVAKLAKCFRKDSNMGSGCTKHAAANVIVPLQEASTISLESSNEKLTKATPTLKNHCKETRPVLTETYTINTNQASLQRANDSQERDSRNAETFAKVPSSRNSATSVHRDSVSSIHDTKAVGRSRTYEDTLKHYDGQTNLFDCKPTKKRGTTDEVFVSETEKRGDENAVANSSRVGLPPAMPRRCRRQPTIENPVCFQEDDQINHYQIQEEIGRGSFATVYRCRSHKNQFDYAMKVISKKRLIRKNGLMARHPKKSRANPLDALHREIAILKKVDHPNVVKLIEVIDDPEIDNVYMIFELIERGPAQEIPTKDPMNEGKARKYFQDMVLGLEYLHHTKIIHRDIKPTNLLLDKNDRVKIADFGVSDIFEGDDDSLNRFAGSPAFQAPEAITGGRVKFSGKAADIWAMGITLFSFVYGKCPFYDNDLMVLYEKIRIDPVVFPEEPLIDPQLQDLISRLLAKDPKQRIQMQEIKEHPWLTRGGREPLPKTAEHCVTIEISDEDLKNSITLISKLSSLVLVKSMLKRRTFSSSRKIQRRSSRSNSTPDISQLESNYLEMQNRVSKSATSLFTRKTKSASTSQSVN